MQPWLVWLASFAGAITSIGIIWSKLVRPIMKWALRLENTMNFVELQMVPNGGSSLRDSINRIEARVNAVEDHLTKPK